MSKERYTIRTEGSRTIVHWEGKFDGPRARPSSGGRFVERFLRMTEPDAAPGDPKDDHPPDKKTP